jgi:Holliday junction resolvase RusA-like endonuclease
MASSKKKRIHIFKAPLHVVLSRDQKRGKKFIINLNQYRNWHYRTSNSIKIKYKELMKSQLDGVKINTPLKLTFKLFKSSNRRSDRANVLSIHEKFFCDAMVEFKCIPDDNDKYIVETSYISGGVDRKNPRVEIHIEEL